MNEEKKIATITKKDNDAILKIIKKYYAFEEVKEKKILQSIILFTKLKKIVKKC